VRRVFGVIASPEKCKEATKQSCEEFAKRGLKLEAAIVGEGERFEIVVPEDLPDDELIELLQDLILICHVAIAAISGSREIVQ
jgi:hypothetical protein